MGNLYTYRNLVLLLCNFYFLALTAQNPSDDGQWSPPVSFGIVPVAVANLPDGKLLTWSSQFRGTFIAEGDGATFTEIFDPFLGANGQALGEFTSNTDHDMFCPGINNLPDGRILSAGGTTSERTSIYDPLTGVWSVADEMNIPRGYQGNVTLSDGSVFTLGGSWSGGEGNKDAELWSPLTGWTLLPGLQNELLWNSNDLSQEGRGIYRVDNHAWLWPAPNGKVFHAGPGERMHWIDVENGGSFTNAGQRGNDTYSMKGTTVMFDIGKILKVGGSRSYDSDTPAKDNSYVIDINGGSATVTATNNNLSYSRTMHNSTVLPNGEVLVTGGLDIAQVFTDVGARLTAEMYNPTTNTWRNVAGMTIARTYHSVGILMLDGRVFVGGGGLCSGPNPDCVNHFDAEIYSPPYLFDAGGNLATRPEIVGITNSASPGTGSYGETIVDYGETLNITTNTTVSDFSLIRFSAATHSTNNEQRRIPLTTTPGTSHSLTIPDRNLLPPGYYMLFAMDSNGVPSIAATVKIGNATTQDYNPNLVLDLNFDEGTGVNLTDNSQYNNNAVIKERDDNGNEVTPNGNYWNTNGVFGGALEMDGLEFQSNTIVEIPRSASLTSIVDNITVMAWVNRDSGSVIPQTGAVSNVNIFGHDYPSIFFGYHNSLYKWSFRTENGLLECYAGYDPMNTWNHIAATYDGEVARLYVNGVEICTKDMAGSITLLDNGTEYETFTSSGFYDIRPGPVKPYGNASGISDELDGRLDELKVFNKALGSEEIVNYYNLGKQTGNPQIVNCLPNTIIAEYKVDDGEWQTGNYINVTAGREVFIRAQTSGEYFVTTPQVNGSTFSSVSDFPNFEDTTAYKIDTYVDRNGNLDRNNGIVDGSNRGQFVLTTANGCATVFNLEVSGGCDPGDTVVSPEWRLTDSAPAYETGNPGEDVTIYPVEGDNVRLSIQPNGLKFNVTRPNGTVQYNVAGDYTINSISQSDSGTYRLESEQGCSVFITISFNNPICDNGGLVPEYTINGVVGSGSGDVVVDEGEEVILSMLPDGVDLTITLPDGSTVGDNHNLGNVTPAQSGIYTFTSGQNCVETINLQVNDAASCPPGSIVPEYRIGGTWLSGEEDLHVDVGIDVTLSMIPNGIGLTITLPDGNTVGDNHLLGKVSESDSGKYLLTSANGCKTTLNLTVGGCPPGSFVPQYVVDGVSGTGSTLTVDEGQDVTLGAVGDTTGLTIRLPNGTVVGGGYDLGSASPSQSGSYNFISADDCIATFFLQVNALENCPSGSVIPEYIVDGLTGSGSTLNVNQGQEVILSMLPDGVGLTITLPDGSTVGDNHNLGNVTPAQSGMYTFTTADGCVEKLDFQVQQILNCPPGDILPEYNVDGQWASGETELQVEEGARVTLSMIPNDIDLTITLPDGSTVGDNYYIPSAGVSHSGAYLLTSAEGCQITLNLTVGDCVPGSVVPEYTVDGTTGSGTGTLVVDEGDSLVLGTVSGASDVTITLPGGGSATGSHDLGGVSPSDAGTYTFTTAAGCSATLDLEVSSSGCVPGSVVPEYTVDGTTGSGAGTLVVDEGDSLVLGTVSGSSDVTITLPDGGTATGVHDVGLVSLSDAGTYTFTTAAGCMATLALEVNPVDCPSGSVLPEYNLDGIWDNGATELTVAEGTRVVLSMVPNGVGLTITLPDGSTVGDNHSLGRVDVTDSGSYLLTTADGCQATLDLTVGDGCVPGSVVPEYTVDGTTGSGTGTLVVDEGDSLVLGTVSGASDVTITLPGGGTATGVHDLGAVSPSDAGTYTFTTAAGCSATLDLEVSPAGCVAGSVVPEYTVDGTTGSGAGTLVVDEGDSLVLGTVSGASDVTISLPGGGTATGVHDVGLVSLSDAGTYTFTTVGGCIATLSLEVNPVDCPPGSVIPEYNLDGIWDNGATALTVAEGTRVVLSMVPNGVGLTITLPDGSTVGDDYSLGRVDVADSGSYLLTTADGCQATLDLTVGDGCVPGSVVPEYTVDGTTGSGTGTLVVDEGDSLVLGTVSGSSDVTITLPGGGSATGSHDLGGVSPSDAGTYTFTTAAGCSATLDLEVSPSGCVAGSVVPEYTVDGTTGSGAGTLVVDEGDSLVLGTVSGASDVTITLPGGGTATGVHDVGLVSLSDAGTYTFTTAGGCIATLSLEVNPVDCPPGSVLPEYNLDGIWDNGATALTVAEGTRVVLSMVPNGVGLTITLPDGSTVGDNHSLGRVDVTDSGSYLFTTAGGCQTTLDLTVGDGCVPGSVVPEYTVNGTTGSGTGTLVVDEGDSLVLGTVSGSSDVTITLPGGGSATGSHDLGGVSPSDAGTYTFTTAAGCSATLDLEVSPSGCVAGSVVPEYTVDGTTGSGAGTLVVDEGDSLVLGTVSGASDVTITLPGGGTATGVHDVGLVSLSDAGTYTFTTAAGCIATLSLEVNPVDCPPGSVLPEYNLDGIWDSGATELTVAEGTRVVLSMVPNGVGLTITLPDGSTVGDNHSLGRVDVTDSGSYLFTTAGGCQATLDLTVGQQAASALESSKEIGTGDEKKNSNDILVFPNPTTGILQLSLINYMGYSLRVNVFNSSQQNVMVHEFDENHSANETLVFGDHMSEGLYRVVIEGPRGNIIQSVILTR